MPGTVAPALAVGGGAPAGPLDHSAVIAFLGQISLAQVEMKQGLQRIETLIEKGHSSASKDHARIRQEVALARHFHVAGTATPKPNAPRPGVLSDRVPDLVTLQMEYTHGLGGRTAAKDFLGHEKSKDTRYCKRNMCVGLEKAGHSVHEVVEFTERAYPTSRHVTEYLDAIQRDNVGTKCGLTVRRGALGGLR